MTTFADKAYTEELTQVERRTARRRRRRLWLWLAAGLAGATVMATWAAGIVTSETTVGAESPAPPLYVNPAGNPPSRFDDALLQHDVLTIGFSGAWGTIAQDAGLFDLDLTAAQFTGGTFYVAVVVLNEPDGWERLQIQFHAVGGACDAAPAWSAPLSSAVLYVETTDSRVNLTELPGGDRYCIGVRATAKASDPSTTYIRRPSSSVVPTMPIFAATVGQSS